MTPTQLSLSISLADQQKGGKLYMPPPESPAMNSDTILLHMSAYWDITWTQQGK